MLHPTSQHLWTHVNIFSDTRRQQSCVLCTSPKWISWGSQCGGVPTAVMKVTSAEWPLHASLWMYWWNWRVWKRTCIVPRLTTTYKPHEHAQKDFLGIQHQHVLRRSQAIFQACHPWGPGPWLVGWSPRGSWAATAAGDLGGKSQKSTKK